MKKLTYVPYQVFCDSCYSWSKGGLRKKDAEREATSHINTYGHNTHVLIHVGYENFMTPAVKPDNK